MRNALLSAAALLTLAACGQPSTTASSGGANACARSATHEVDFTTNEAADIVTARSEGPSCAQASVTLTVRAANGDLLWVFSNTHYDMTAGGSPPPIEGAPAISNEQMDQFLSGWANVSMMRSGDLPEWKADKPSLTESVEGFAYHTDFSRDVYEAMRARNSALLCYAAAAEATQCLIIDPATNAPGVIAAYGP